MCMCGGQCEEARGAHVYPALLLSFYLLRQGLSLSLKLEEAPVIILSLHNYGYRYVGPSPAFSV